MSHSTSAVRSFVIFMNDGIKVSVGCGMCVGSWKGGKVNTGGESSRKVGIVLGLHDVIRHNQPKQPRNDVIRFVPWNSQPTMRILASVIISHRPSSIVHNISTFNIPTYLLYSVLLPPIHPSIHPLITLTNRTRNETAPPISSISSDIAHNSLNERNSKCRKQRAHRSPSTLLQEEKEKTENDTSAI